MKARVITLLEREERLQSRIEELQKGHPGRFFVSLYQAQWHVAFVTDGGSVALRVHSVYEHETDHWWKELTTRLIRAAQCLREPQT